MTDQAIEDDIAFIRRTIEGGRAYARGASPDMLVWGLAVAAGYLAAYAFDRGWSQLAPGWTWAAAILLPWAYSLRRVVGRLSGRAHRARSAMAHAMAMLWLGCGLFLTSESFALILGGVHFNLFDSIVAGTMGIAFFASSVLCNLGWMRAVALAWWASEFVWVRLAGDPAAPLLGAAMMFVFLAGPGLVLFGSARRAA